jgi:hypothetical protein
MFFSSPLHAVGEPLGLSSGPLGEGELPRYDENGNRILYRPDRNWFRTDKEQALDDRVDARGHAGGLVLDERKRRDAVNLDPVEMAMHDDPLRRFQYQQERARLGNESAVDVDTAALARSFAANYRGEPDAPPTAPKPTTPKPATTSLATTGNAPQSSRPGLFGNFLSKWGPKPSISGGPSATPAPGKFTPPDGFFNKDLKPSTSASALPTPGKVDVLGKPDKFNPLKPFKWKSPFAATA